ncbi:recombination regulator RecX [Halalkalibacterium halodurans]|uniref:Regulatory protein RecX n=1 Tax=Halalkalibacterium halodurans (strain ATCC BAA-125 / DSM 18197 / FERM 7344 / JCM 9153 / C-125) TaxID=272558 RepID=RECX_HALH5|nr:recombination regulator RecX [Halalkalibacterium halodurans]Q9KEC9.1 RecName: Full=Regulatory protein RecX [Halalkalibacterium halodurans C-125]MDY7221422.1 recombination regulator RecX [Halalkalibacterium halodurans]MDY7240661.1 recombination regulator RecX [Halalkalibacterium halodurans]MED4082949.1 recombination regulator RecX [Halalkalibacterium halodurans]MED4086780.1 recombination regulator RecX [Halalkalibacterium halodurans]MED4106284.1 recombination regulator RecX [Halalkalibacter
MAIITRIEVQKRNNERYNIFIHQNGQDVYAFSVDEQVLIKQGLRKGLDIDAEQMKQILYEDEVQKTFNLALHYLSYRMRSVHEVRTYLKKKDREEPIIEHVLHRLTEQRLLDDHAFAEAFIQTKRATTSKGPLKLKQELAEKGVSEKTIEGALTTFSYEEQVEQVKAWLEKQKGRTFKGSSLAWKQKLSRQLLAKGYTSPVIEEAFADVPIKQEEEEEWEALKAFGEKAMRKYAGKKTGWELQQKVKQALYRKGFSLEMIERYLND